MKVKDLINKLSTLNPKADVIAEDGEFGPYDITDVQIGFINREGYFVWPSSKTEKKLPKTYKPAVLLY